MHPSYSETGFDDCAFLDYENMSNLYLYETGEYQCPSSYSYGPCARKHSILHFCLSGKGFLEINGNHYDISEGEGFLVPSGVSSYYEADADDPWAYIWFHVGGPLFHDVLHRSGLSADNPVFIPENVEDTPIRAYHMINTHRDSELFCIGELMLLCDYLCRESVSRVNNDLDPKLAYVKKTIRFIQLHYNSPDLTVEGLAAACGINRSYLSRPFKDATGNSIHEYITTTRMRKAASLLKKKNTTVQDIAVTVGFSDIFTFSKAFKKYYGLSPKEYIKDEQ